MFEPVKVGFGEFLAAFYDTIVPTTKPLEEFITRGLPDSIAIAPSRMVDSAEDMLASWQRDDNGVPTSPFKAPVIIFAVSKDYVPTGRDFTKQVSDPIYGIIPDDIKERVFTIRAIAGDIRAQVAIFAMDEPTAKSLAAQFLLFIDSGPNRRFTARHTFAGLNLDWPVQIESTDTPFVNSPSGSKNLTILVCDLTLKAEIPLIDAPKDGEPNDGKGVPGTNDPAGWPVVIQTDLDDKMLDIQKIVT